MRGGGAARVAREERMGMLAAASWWESGSAVFVAAPTLELGAVVDGRRHLDGALLVQQQRGA